MSDSSLKHSSTFSSLKARHASLRMANDIRYEQPFDVDSAKCSNCGVDFEILWSQQAVQCPRCRVTIPVSDEMWAEVRWRRADDWERWRKQWVEVNGTDVETRSRREGVEVRYALERAPSSTVTDENESQGFQDAERLRLGRYRIVIGLLFLLLLIEMLYEIGPF